MDYTNTNDNKPIRHTTFKASKQKENKVSKPIIRNLKIIEPDEELLKTLYIKNPGDKLYEENKHLLDENYQIISGEVEVNDVTFPLYIVISKDERNNFIGRVRTMASAVAKLYVEQREEMGFPLCK